MTDQPLIGVKPWPIDSSRKIWKWICQPQSRHPESLYWHVMIAIGEEYFMRANPTKQWMGPIQRQYCKWLQGHLYRFMDNLKAGIQERIKLATLLPRGYLKSQINIGSHLWMHLEIPDMSSRYGAATDDMARDFYKIAQSIWEGSDSFSVFSSLYGVWKSPDRTWDKFNCNHAYRKNLAQKEPSWKTFSVQKAFTSHHPTRATMDDPVVLEKLNEEGTAVWLDKANRVMRTIRPAMPESSVLDMVATRYDPNDTFGTLLPREGVASWAGHPIDWYMDKEVKIDPKRGQWHVFFIDGFPEETRQSTAPYIYSNRDLEDLEQSDPFGLASQIRNNPTKGDHAGLNYEQIEEMYVPKENLPTDCELIICCDTAFKNEKNFGIGDDSVAIFLARDPRPVSSADYYYIDGFGHNRYREEDFTLDLVLKIQAYQDGNNIYDRKFRISLVTDERSPGKIAVWFNYLKLICRSKNVLCPPTLEIPRGGKPFSRQRDKSKVKARIRHAMAFWADGRMKLIRNAPNVTRLIAQMLGARHDDWADAAADGFHPDVHRLSISSTQTQEQGALPIGPGDEYLRGGSPIIDDRDRYDSDVIDTIYYGKDEWS